MIELMFIILIIYFIQILLFYLGWHRLPKFEIKTDLKLSIVIASRNEASNIPHLLHDLSNQDYPTENVEIIIVDDGSTDNSLELLKQSTFKIYESDGVGKKAAIDQAIRQSTYDLILTTDADCRLPKNWIKSMIAPFSQKEVQMICGPVAIGQIKSFFQKCQALEFMSLMGSTAGAIGIGHAFMSNGANMAFRKSIYFNSEKNIASGDDVFLLHHVKKKGGEIVFVKDKNAIVQTQAELTLKGFFNQRKRWASKSTSYKDVFAVWISLLVLLTNVAFVSLLLQANYVEWLFFFMFKSMIDTFFMISLSSFFGFRKYLNMVLIVQLLYPFYVLWVALSAQFSSYHWKDRKHKK